MDKDILAEAKDTFKICEEAEADNRASFLENVRFWRLGEQWPEQIKQQREKEGRPCLTINKGPAFIRQVTNDARQNKPSVKVHPVDDSADIETAKIINGLIRNIEYTSNADVAYDTAIDYSASGGYGFWCVDIDYACDDSFDLDLKIRRVADPLKIYGDPYSTEADSADWNDAFELTPITDKEFEAKYPDAEKTSWDGDDEKERKDGDDLVLAKYWKRRKAQKKLLKLSDGQVMYEEDFMRVDPETGFSMQQIAYNSGVEVVGSRMVDSHQVKHCLLSGSDKLEDDDWVGRYIPIVPVYGEEINVEGKRIYKGVATDSMDAQRMFNYWRTASTELVALAPKAPYVGPKGAFKTDANKWASANTKSHSHIEYDGNVPPQRQPFAGIPAGALQEALNASDDMKAIMGLYDASLGARSNETSGKAIMARQKEGDVSTFHFMDNLNRAIRHTGRILIDLIPHVYNEPRIIRVMGEDRTPQTVQINQPMQENGKPRIYDLTTGKYDLTVQTGPSYTTKRQESAEQMMVLIQSYPDAAPVIGDLLVKNLDWPGAEEIAERLKAVNPALKPPADPMQDPQIVMKREELNIKQQTAAQDMQIEREKMQLQREQAQLDAEIKISEHNADLDMMREKHNLTITQGRDKAMQDMGQSMADSLGDTAEGMPVHPVVGLIQSMMQSNQQIMQGMAELVATNAAMANAPKTITMTTSQGKQLTAQVQPNV